MTLKLTRNQYAEMYGPTVGDRVRLGDTNLFIEVERDLIEEGGGYGNEIKFGGGKVIRDGMGQSPLALGADFVMLGRPFLFASGANGEHGVMRLVELLKDEVSLTLAQLGCKKLEELERDVIIEN